MERHDRTTTIITSSDEKTIHEGEKFALLLQPGNVVCLYGDLGAGKTTFTKGIIKGLGVDSRVVSPTFSIVRQYTVESEDITTVYHLDLYRVENESSLETIGVQELFADQQGITIIEWPEKLYTMLPKNRIDISFSYHENDSREISIIQRKQ